MKFSAWPNLSQSPADALAVARWADQHGWYGVWAADHYMVNTGSTEVRRGDTHECWAMLPAMAAVTRTVRIGSLVAPTSVHHPAVLANRAATIDHISEGRMVLGLGAGWQINEHHAYGIALEPPRQRVDRFEEAIQVVRALLTDDVVDFAGQSYRITGAVADPKPIQTPLPIVVGTKSPRMMRITARHADEWNTWGAPELAGERRHLLAVATEQVGRQAPMWMSVQALIVLTDDPDRARAAVEHPDMGPMTIAGTASQLIDTIGAYAELGFDELIVPDFNLGRTAHERLEMLDRIRTEVLEQV